MVDSAWLQKEDAELAKLPTAKVNRVSVFGGLNYVSEDYFTFCQRIEFVLRSHCRGSRRTVK